MWRRISLIIGAVILLCAAGPLFPAGEKFPIFVVDSSFQPVTGAWIKCATWGSRPPSYVGGSAIEIGNGQYYFEIGTCDSCVPPGYYDIWRDGQLDSAYAGIYIGLGNVPPANSIGSPHVIDGSLTFTADVCQAYGSVTAPGGNVITIDHETKLETSGTEDVVVIDTENHGSGTGKPVKTSALLLSNKSLDLDDEVTTPRCLKFNLLSHPTESQQPEFLTGPVGVFGRVMCENQGSGVFVDVRNTDDVIGSFTMPMEYHALGFYLEAKEIAEWWNPPSTHQVAGLAGYMRCRKVPEAIGAFIDVQADSSVPWVHGAHLRIYGTTTFPSYGYGLYTQVEAADFCYGVKTAATGNGPDCRTYGYFAQIGQDETEGTGDFLAGIWTEACFEALGSDQDGPLAYGGMLRASADTAYGAYGEATSDNSAASNRAYGVLGCARRAPANYGVYGTAKTGTNAVKNYGVYGYAEDAGTNYGVYGETPGGPGNWAGYFKGGAVVADSIFMPTSDPPNTGGYRYYCYVTTQGADETAYNADLTTSGTQYGYYASGTSADYGVYISGAQTYLGGTVTCTGLATISNAMVATLNFEKDGSVRRIGTSTVPGTADSVNVTGCAIDTDSYVLLTAKGPGSNLYVTNQDTQLFPNQFTIKFTCTADTDVNWVILEGD